MNRNEFLKTFVFGGSLAFVASQQVRANGTAAFILPALPYAYNALEPHFDTATMEIHHQRHHAAYVTNLNKAVEEQKLNEVSLEDLLKQISKYSTATRNNAGGHWNHSFFWESLTPNGKALENGKFQEKLMATFGSMENFQTAFQKAATGVFGSGWAWLILQNDELKIVATANQDNPLMDVAKEQGIPLLGLDVWEHAYYLKYQNKRADYIKAFWNVVDWQRAERIFLKK